MRDYIVNYVERQETSLTEKRDNNNGKIVSIVNELRGLKNLLDEGILTQEEFEAKKKQLLGL